MKKTILSGLAICLLSSTVLAAENPGLFAQGEAMYKAGRYSEAVEFFDLAIKKKDRAAESKAYIERIRKETVERIRNKNLTGIAKSSWQSKYYFMNIVDNKILVGVSIQEVFDRDSVNFRAGAVEALSQLAAAIAKADNKQVRIELISEVPQEIPNNKEILNQQLASMYSYLSLAARGQSPKF